MKEVFLILFGFILGLIPPWLSRIRRIKTHWCAIRSEIEICREKAEKLLNDNVQSPLYRLPVLAFQVSFPALIADGVFGESELLSISRFFNQAQDINRGLDNAADMVKAGDHEKLNSEYRRNCEKAKELIGDANNKGLYDAAKTVVEQEISKNFLSNTIKALNLRLHRGPR
jgi:hypothetical protein